MNNWLYGQEIRSLGYMVALYFLRETPYRSGFQGGSAGAAKDVDLIPGSRRSPGGMK